MGRARRSLWRAGLDEKLSIITTCAHPISNILIRSQSWV
jgi:hypothetical protein